MLCPQLCVHTSRSSQREQQAHIWENIFGFEGIREHTEQQRQKQNRERAEDKEAWTGLRKGRSEQMAPDLAGQPVQPCLDSQHKASVLKDFCSAKVSIKATFIRQQGKPWRKWLEACYQKKYDGAGPTTVQFLILKENPIPPLKWSKPTYGSGQSRLIQAEEGIIASVASKAKGGICITVLRVGVAALRNNITPGLQSSQMYWLFAEQFHFQSMYILYSFTDENQLSLMESRHLFWYQTHLPSDFAKTPPPDN